MTTALPLPATPGLIRRLSFEAYQQIKADNFSTVKELARSPLHYQHRIDNPRAATAPMVLGKASHTAVLEPHRLAAEYVLWDERTEGGKVRPRNGKDWESFKAANAGKQVVKADELGLAMAMRDAARGSVHSMRYLRKGESEVSMVWRDAETGRTLKGRLDWLTHVDDINVLVGIKTSKDCRPIGFGNQAARSGYHLQWAMYFDGYATITGREPRVVEIVIESFAPHDVTVYSIPSEIIEQGREEYRKLLVALGECERTGQWPGTSDGEQILSLPSWVYHAEDDLTELGLEA